MIRTITIGSCISVQGLYEGEAANGLVAVRVGNKIYQGRPVA